MHYLCVQVKASLDTLASPIPRENFKGPQSVIEPLLAGFQAQWALVREAAVDTHAHGQELVKALGKGSGVIAVDYTKVKGGIEVKEHTLTALEEGVWQVCEKREHRWKLAIQLNQFEPDVDEVRGHHCYMWP
jgi:hypothetical protein